MARFQVAVAKCDDYSRLDQAFEELKEKARLFSFAEKLRNKKVLVKPNILGTYRPERAATTHPELVRQVVRWLRSAGAQVTVGDNCGVGGYGINERAAKISGILDASEGAYVNVARDVVEKEIESRFFKKLVLSRAMMEADYIVNLPKLKTHTLSLLTLGIKNMFGMLAGASKGKVHNSAQRLEEFGEALSDIFRIRPPELTIIDGVIGMDGNGPNVGRVRPIGYLLAGENAPAVDLVVAKMAGADAKRMHHIRITGERGLGPIDLKDVEITGEHKPIPRFKLPSTLAQQGFLGFIVNRYVYRSIINSKLILNPEKCNQDRICLKACPSGAMNWKNDRPQIDYQKCIRCMCCHELCTEGAWEIAGLLRRFTGNKP